MKKLIAIVAILALTSCREPEPPVVVNVELGGAIKETGNLIKEAYHFYKDSAKVDTTKKNYRNTDEYKEQNLEDSLRRRN